ncbi:MAG: PRC-barrel domain-containing protein [Alphaproteobacteria bacterium]
MTRVPLGLALALLLAAAPRGAWSQAPSLKEVADGGRAVPPWNMPVEKLRGMEIAGPKGDRIGAVEAVLEDAAGAVAAVVVRFRSTVGTENLVAVPFGQIEMKNERLVTKLAREQLGGMPLWQR